jgi:hypothetical protein
MTEVPYDKVGLVWYVTWCIPIQTTGVDSSRIFDLTQSVLQMHGLYNTIITNYGNIEYALDPVWSITASIIAANCVYLLVQVRHGLTSV